MNSEPSAQYIYGVIPATAHLSAVVGSPLADDDRAPARFLHADKLADDEIIGHDGIRSVVHEDIAAIISPAKQVDITKMRKDALAKMLIAHQKVIELVMQGAATVLPFRLGTYVPSEKMVTEILLKGKKLIRPLFEAIGGKIEMDVVATWADFAAVLKEIGEEDEIKKFKQSLIANSRGVSVDDQMKIGLMIKEALDRRRLEISRQITEHLRSASCTQCRHENMNDQMVMNSAFLIEAKNRPEFECVLDELNTQFAEKLNFRCVGPLAPYSFYTLELKTIRWEDVDWARHIMGMGDAASAEEIKKAFQHAAQTKHPDHCAQTVAVKEAERSFNELNSARRIVLEYALCCEQTVPEPQIVFSEEKVRQNSLLVKVRNGKDHG